GCSLRNFPRDKPCGTPCASLKVNFGITYSTNVPGRDRRAFLGRIEGMDVFLTGLKTAIDTLGATVLLPIVIFIIAIVLGAKAGRAFRAAVTIGVAFIAINLVLGLMLGSIGDVAQAIVTNTGIKRDIIDVGWPSAAAIAFGSSVGLWVIPIGIAVNIVLLLTRLTCTLNVDVWNFWHFAFI